MYLLMYLFTNKKLCNLILNKNNIDEKYKKKFNL